MANLFWSTFRDGEIILNPKTFTKRLLVNNAKWWSSRAAWSRCLRLAPGWTCQETFHASSFIGSHHGQTPAFCRFKRFWVKLSSYLCRRATLLVLSYRLKTDQIINMDSWHNYPWKWNAESISCIANVFQLPQDKYCKWNTHMPEAKKRHSLLGLHLSVTERSFSTILRTRNESHFVNVKDRRTNCSLRNSGRRGRTD